MEANLPSQRIPISWTELEFCWSSESCPSFPQPGSRKWSGVSLFPNPVQRCLSDLAACWLGDYDPGPDVGNCCHFVGDRWCRFRHVFVLIKIITADKVQFSLLAWSWRSAMKPEDETGRRGISIAGSCVPWRHLNL